MKINHLRFCACLFSLLFLCHFSFSQEKGPIIPVFSFEKGLGIRAPNDLFYLNFGIRIQSRISYTSANTDIFGFENVEARVRRMRLKFDGFVLNPKINYKLELGFENTSIDFEDASIPNVLLDAVHLIWTD
jgi:phosphate-selective porin OprO/OprP